MEKSLRREQEQMLDQYLRFGALISHEFRNPLAIIESQVGLLRKLRQSDTAPDVLDRHLGIIQSASQRLLGLFNHWLSGDRLRNLGQDLQIEPIELNGWLHDLLDANPQYQSSHRILLSEISLAGQPQRAMADEQLLEIAIVNLLDNACKYSSPDSEVRLVLHPRGRWIGISVSDQGPGIPDDVQSSVFADYERLQPEGGIPGIGLGLAFVRRIAELLHGRIELHSEPGHGCEFCLWLPVADETGKS